MIKTKLNSPRRTAGWMVALGLAVIAPFRGPAETIVLDPFRFASQAAAEQTWVASPISPAVAAEAQGLRLPCPFSRNIPRVYWSKDVSLNLSRCTSFELDLSCDNPHAFRSLNLYLKSGDGWYVWSTSLPEPGRQRVHVLKSGFSIEGKPAGWGRIDQVRFSAWQGIPADTSVTVYGLRARSDSILLIRNTGSTESAAERSFALKVTQRVSRWLLDLGISHGLITDDEVAAGGLAGARVAVLCYNPHPPEKELAALRKFVAGGGRLMVFYAADPGLAELMHVKLGSYKKADTPGVWSSFSFAGADDWGLPARVYQESFNVLPVYPADPSARVLATWENAQGKKTDDPAWIESPAGLWMTHVLLDDDVQNKRTMLLGLLGHFDPGVWADAAQACADRVGKIDSCKSLAETRAAILAGADRGNDPPRIGELLAHADASYADLRSYLDQGQYIGAIEQARRLRADLVEGYARAQPSKPGEFRGVWDHDGTGWYPGNWDRSCRILAGNGITAVFPNMLWGGLAHYPSKLLPQSYTVQRFGDQIEQCVDAAHKNGLQVHIWTVCWNLSGAPAEFVERMKKQNRVQVTVTGRTLPWLCPSNPQNISLLIQSLREIVTSYDVDGIQLDYIRYSGEDACYCTSCRNSFAAWLGQDITDWPYCAKPGGRLSAKFKRWRSDQITTVVRKVSKELRAMKPGIKLSAAVWGNYPGCIGSVGQDWAKWLKEGLVDFVCPMNYTVDATHFANLVNSQLGLPNARGRIYPGLGVTADESQLRPDQVIEQVSALRRLGAPGFMLFDMSYTLREETLPTLRLGITRSE